MVKGARLGKWHDVRVVNVPARIGPKRDECASIRGITRIATIWAQVANDIADWYSELRHTVRPCLVKPTGDCKHFSHILHDRYVFG